MSRDEPERPRRPAIPVALYALVVVVVTIRAMLREGMVGVEGIAGRAIAGLGVMCTLVTMAAWKRNASISVVFVVLGASMSSGLLLGTRVLEGCAGFLTGTKETPVSACSFFIENDPTQRDDTYRCRATMRGHGLPPGDVWLTLSEPVEMGSTIWGIGRFTPNGDDDWGTASRMQGVWGSVRMVRVTQVDKPEGMVGKLRSARGELLRLIDPAATPERALLAGCVCGWRPGLVTFGLNETFSRCGLSHLIAVSGGHMAILTGLLGAVLVRLRVRPKVRTGILVVLCGLFVLLCGMPLSAIRSWMMTCSALVAGLVGRRSHALTGVSLAGLGIALVDPVATGHMGYLLSVASVAGLCIFSPYVGYVCDSLVPRMGRSCMLSRKMVARILHLRRAIIESLALSLTAQLVTMPLVAQSFGEVSPMGPVAGVLVSYPFTLFVGVGMLSMAFWWAQPIRDSLFVLADSLARALLGICKWCASGPFGPIQLPQDATPYLLWVICALLLVMWPRVSVRWLRRVCTLLAGVLVAYHLRWRFFAPPRICVLDIGQGDSILVQEGGSAVLVDAGPDGTLLDALARNHVTHLDALVITHLHADHYEGAKELVGRVGCDRVMVARGVAAHIEGSLSSLEALSGGEVEELGYGDVLRVSGFEMRVVWPMSEVDGDENSESLELLVTYDDGRQSLRALLTGDAERDEMSRVLASGDVGDIDVLKVGHHGSAASVTAKQVWTLDPEISVASAGEGNAYGHPTKECVAALESSGGLFLCTKDVGDVEARPGASGPIITTQRPMQCRNERE